MTPKNLPFRQIHLDFHTSPHIPSVAQDFDATEFANTLKAAHVNSVTAFTMCHHGWCYYPTQVGAAHPHLTHPDLFGEMLDACHQAGIRVCAYSTVTWNERAWHTHPEWRHLTVKGANGGPSSTPLKPGWKNVCMNTGYADFLLAQMSEVVSRYDIDGFFIDIVNYLGGGPCVCSTCLDQMHAAHIDPTDETQLRLFSLERERAFMRRCTQTLHAIKPDIDLFYNSRLTLEWDPQMGNRPEMDDFTHIEIESLPGDNTWGYDHFPMYARYYQDFDKDLVAMTGRFHTAWGDFGGLRNQAALEFEAFQGLAHGARISIGDQLHPNGVLNPSVYQRIGAVYAQVEQYESLTTDSVALPEIGVLISSGEFGKRTRATSNADKGAMHILEQLKYQFAFLDAGSDFSPYTLLILPDEVRLDAPTAARLRDYVTRGGSLLISHRSGLSDESGDFLLSDFMGVHYVGEADYAPDYLVWQEGITTDTMLYANEQQGVKITATPQTTVLAYSGAPYFNRTWEHFCSHQYTPFSHVTDSPIITQKDRVITIARPLFGEYATSGRYNHKQVIQTCIERLLPEPQVKAHGLPSSAIVTVRQQNHDLIVHILNYLPGRNPRQLDVIEDRVALHDVHLSIRAAQAPNDVQLFASSSDIRWDYAHGYVALTIPVVNGYAIVKITNALG